MSMTQKQVEQRLANIVATGKLTYSDNSGGEQIISATLTSGEQKSDMEKIEPFGFSSSPNAGAEIVALFPGGGRSRGLIINAGGRGYRFKAEPGGVAIYDDQGQSVHLGGGNIVIKGVGDIEMETDGEIKMRSSKLTHNDVDIGSTHKHKDVTSGYSNTGTPA